MILEFSDELFKDSTPETSRLLLRLVSRVEEAIPGRFILRIHGDLQADPQGPFAAWTKQLPEWYRDTLNDRIEQIDPLVDATTPEPDQSEEDVLYKPGCWRRGGPLKVKIIRGVKSDWRALALSLQDVLDLVDEPVHLRLEHDVHDREFLIWLASPSQRRDLRASLRVQKRIFVHGGGTGSQEAWLGTIARKKALEPHEYKEVWRTWIMFDRDSDREDARKPKEDALRRIELCERINSVHGVPLSWVCLQRREIESYISTSGLRARARREHGDLIRTLQAWRRRADRMDWAWSYDMKNGLLGDLCEEVDDGRRNALRKDRLTPRTDELKPPFDELNSAERRALAFGLGKDVLNDPLKSENPPYWLEDLGDEYDLGPTHQISRAALIQSIFDRM